MLNPSSRCCPLQIMCFVLLALMLAGAQTKEDGKKNDRHPAAPGTDYSGMYSFLRDGEFVQVTVEDQGHVTGFVSRYGAAESDRGVFLDHFFKSGKLDGNQLAFATEIVHGVSFEFREQSNVEKARIRATRRITYSRELWWRTLRTRPRRLLPACARSRLRAFHRTSLPPRRKRNRMAGT